MMAGLFSLLSTNAAIAALAGTRVYPLTLPNDPTLPAITMQRVGSQVAARGFSTRGLEKVRIQFDCWATTLAAADGLRQVLVDALDGYAGTLSDGTYLQRAQYLQTIDYFEQQALQVRCSVEFYLWAALT